MKSFLIFLREIKEALINIKRSIFLTFIYFLAIVVSLYSIGMIFFFLDYSNGIKKGVESKIEISFYLKKDTTQDRINEIQNEIKLIKGVESIRYISPDEALENLIKEYPEYENILKDLNKNPLPPTFFVKPESVYSVKNIINAISKFPEIQDFFYSKDLVDKILFSIKTFSFLSLIVFAIFIGIFIFFLSSTISLSLYARKEDIEIMKLIGTQPSYIKRPFYYEGIILSIFGSIISSILLNKSYIELNKLLNLILPFFEVENFVNKYGFKPYIYLNILSIIISIIVSYFVIKRYLKEIY
ncbi:MAG: permease-like cell division protein FtsX [Caldisericia bacterium]|nr:permease-like cell division protein FtsX [Caldisericia bacterium]